MKLSKLLTLITLLLLIGCSDTHKLVRYETGESKLTRDAAAYILLPKDGQYSTIVYHGSGVMVAQAVATAFRPYLREIKIAPELQPFESELVTAKEQGFAYVFKPEITHWEDRNTIWSSIPDQVNIKLSIIDADSGMIIDSAELGGISKMMTFSNDRPEDLLPKPLAEYAASLFN